MTRVLIISPTRSHPMNQGNSIRVAQMAGALKARGFVVDFFYYALDGLDDESVANMRAEWDSLHCVGMEGFHPRQRFPEYWGLDDWIAPAPMEAVRRLAESRDYALVICNYVWCSALMEPFYEGGAKLVIDAHDAFGDRHKLIREAGMTPHWYYTSVEEEGRGFDRADAILAIQDHEGRSFRERTRQEVLVIEYSTPPVILAKKPSGKLKVGYFGSGNPWNVRSVQMFDALLASLPDREALEDRFEFLLYGGICAAPGTYEVFESLGFVEKPEHFYEDVDIVINPMVGGTGLKIKTVEALAFGRPIVSTAAGGAGLEHIHPDICLPDLEALVARLREIHTRADAEVLAKEMQAGYAAFHEETERKIDLMLKRLGVLVPQSAKVAA